MENHDDLVDPMPYAGTPPPAKEKIKKKRAVKKYCHCEKDAAKSMNNCQGCNLPLLTTRKRNKYNFFLSQQYDPNSEGYRELMATPVKQRPALISKRYREVRDTYVPPDDHVFRGKHSKPPALPKQPSLPSRVKSKTPPPSPREIPDPEPPKPEPPKRRSFPSAPLKKLEKAVSEPESKDEPPEPPKRRSFPPPLSPRQPTAQEQLKEVASSTTCSRSLAANAIPKKKRPNFSSFVKRPISSVKKEKNGKVIYDSESAVTDSDR
jgi:hypothetical protein